MTTGYTRLKIDTKFRGSMLEATTMRATLDPAVTPTNVGSNILDRCCSEGRNQE